MSDQGYGSQGTQEEQEDDGGIFCQSCSPFARKLGYYLTFAAGVVVFIVGLINLLTLSVTPLIIGSVIIFLCPLWIKSPKACCMDLKNPLRLTSCLIYLVFLVATIIVTLVTDLKVLPIILGICLGIAGIWYFLSFFKNGQKAFLACIKSCCGKSEGSEGQTYNST